MGSHSYDEYKKAMDLLKKGYGLIETCRILGWPETRKKPTTLLEVWKT